MVDNPVETSYHWLVICKRQFDCEYMAFNTYKEACSFVNERVLDSFVEIVLTECIPRTRIRIDYLEDA